MHLRSRSLPIVFLLAFIFSGCLKAPTRNAREITGKEAASYVQDFRKAAASPFALSYTIDLSVLRQMGEDVSELYVANGLKDSASKVFFIRAVNAEGQVVENTGAFMQDETNLYLSDRNAAFSKAMPVATATATELAANFQKAGLDSVLGFSVSHKVITALARNAEVRNLRIFHAICDNKRGLVIKGVGARGEDLNTAIYFQDGSTLCPPACDSYESTSPAR
jgi:hypothetical protein